MTSPISKGPHGSRLTASRFFYQYGLFFILHFYIFKLLFPTKGYLGNTDFTILQSIVTILPLVPTQLHVYSYSQYMCTRVLTQ